MNFPRCKINNAVLKNNFQQNHEEVQQILSITPLRFSVNKIFADKHATFVDHSPPLLHNNPQRFLPRELRQNSAWSFMQTIPATRAVTTH